MILFNLFFEFLKIGAFSFGGGMGTLPYIYEMCNTTNWISKDSINNLLTLSQVTPGPLACNIGTIVGLNVNGMIGAIFCNIGFVIPAILFMGIGYKFYNTIQNNKKINEVIKMVRASALALIITSSISMFKNVFINNLEINNNNIFLLINYKSILLSIGIFLIIKYKKINSIFLIIISGLISGIISL